MSDVWQGPGWWLASDGKWYPADAEPGAVYDGDLTNDDSSSTEAGVDDDAEMPAVVAPEAPAEPAVLDVDASGDAGDISASVTADSIADPAVPDVDVTIPTEVEGDSAPTGLSFGSAPVAESMPEPVVQQGPGWQAIGDEPEPEPERDLEDEAFASLAGRDAPTEEEGWTSAFEERQASGEVLDDTPKEPEPLSPTTTALGATALGGAAAAAIDLEDLAEVPPAPDVTFPDVSAPDVSVPDVSAPDLSVPDVSVPDVSAPGLSIPDVSVPDVSVPDVSVPDVSVPDMAVPDVSVPDVSVPDVSVPDVSVPDVSVPDVSVPDVSAPDLTIPDVSAPDLTIPDVSAPDLSAPDMAMPGAAIPEVSAPEAQVEEVMSIGADLADTRQPTVPIERQDAWRKPIAPEDIEGLRPESMTPRSAPDVVDLAIPQDAPPEEVVAPKRNWSMWLGGLLVLALIGLIAWFIAMLFSGNSTTDTTDSSTTSDAVVAVEPTNAPSTDGTDEPASTESPATSEDDASPPATQSTQASVFDLRAGDCIVGDIGAGQVTKVEKVDCDIEHQFEVYREALIESSITTFDETAISAYAEEVCRTSLAAYIPANDDRNLKFKFLQPTEDSWNQPEDPDRVITCLLFDGDGDPLIGRAN